MSSLIKLNFLNYAHCVESGRNPYDARRPCDRSKDGDLCYRQMSWIENWLNNPKIKATLGVDPEREFASCNMEVNQAFTANGDGAHNSAALLPELVNDGVRLLVYAGNAGMSFYTPPWIPVLTIPLIDMMCNFIVRIAISSKAFADPPYAGKRTLA